MMQRWKITVEYEGGAYAGWQRQSEAPSVQLAIEDAIHAFCQQRITIHAAGRTDAGVHARGQVAHFDLDYGGRPLSGFELAKAINAHLRPALVSVVAAEPVAGDFHARFSAVSKIDTYRIVQRSPLIVLDHGRVWHVWRPLDVEAMRAGAAFLVGHHDFTTFRDSGCQAKSPEKTLDRLEVEMRPYDAFGGEEFLIRAQARSFLHHQVRNMVGTLVMVGEGKWRPERVGTALAARDRAEGGPTAPPEGLYLDRVMY